MYRTKLTIGLSEFQVKKLLNSKQRKNFFVMFSVTSFNHVTDIQPERI